MAVLTLSACTGAPQPPAVTGSTVTEGPPVPAACQLVTPADVERAIGVAVRRDEAGGSRNRCRYASEDRDEVEITVDRPGFDGVVASYRALKPDAERVEGIGEDGALLAANETGELVFVKGRTRFFVVVASPSSGREALLILARAAVERM